MYLILGLSVGQNQSNKMCLIVGQGVYIQVSEKIIKEHVSAISANDVWD